MSIKPFTLTEPGPSVFANRSFLLLWLGQTLSVLGDRIHQVALMWYVFKLTGSVSLTGAMLVVTSLPSVLLSPITGTIADRWDRKKLMVGADLARAMLVAAIAYLALTQRLDFTVLVVASALLSTLTAVFTPANMAMLPTLVPSEDLMRANAVMGTSISAAGLAGPALGGVLVAAIGASGAFGLNSLSFGVSVLCLLLIAYPPASGPKAGESFWHSLRAGIALLVEQPTIGGMLACFGCLNFFTMPVLLFLPYFANQVFHVGAQGFGFLEAAVPTGMTVAGLLMARIPPVRRRFPVIVGTVAATAVMYAAMSFSGNYALFLLALAAAGGMIGALNIVVMAFFQERVPAAQMGRFMGVLMSVVSSLIPLSYGLYGALGATIPPAVLLLVNAGAIAWVAAMLWLVPGLRQE